MVARALLTIPGVGWLLRRLAGAPTDDEIGAERIVRIVSMAQRLVRDLGIEPVPATAAAEAVFFCQDAGLFYQRVALEGLTWWVVAAAGSPSGDTFRFPLPYATSLLQDAVAASN